ncbi:MAG TPA: hypothetical protein VFX03_06415, partial [Thermomicrobiales bacterium]|nr:hypothetical protein [Thermomicrobiales bacterium]
MLPEATTTAAGGVAAPAPRRRFALVGDDNLSLYGVMLATAAIWLVFQILTDRLFLTPINLANLARQTAVLGVAAAATSLVIIMGEFDLAIGAAQALTTSIFGVLLISHGWSVPAAIVLTVAVGVGLGLLEGFLIVTLSGLGFSVASFIITLGGMLAYGGLALLVLPESISP